MEKWLRQAKHIWVGGHRGCTCEYPENSIKAMEEGIRRGADYLEIDVQLTKDEIPVIIHDTQVKCSGRKGYVHEFEYRQLKPDIAGLCTLEEALDWGRAEQVCFGLEIKTVPYVMQGRNQILMEKIVPLLNRHEMTEEVFVFGQDYQVLRHLKRIDKNVSIGLIVPFVPADPVRLMREMDACIYLSYIFNVTPKMVRDLQDNGYYVDGALLKEERWIDAARELGVNMFETDYPERQRQRTARYFPQNPERRSGLD